MTIWTPRIEEIPGPRYLAIAEALNRDVQAGRLSPGSQLPTHRDLAERLGVTVGTVSRAYAEAERRGLTQGEIGRGTFVRPLSIPAPNDHPDPTAVAAYSPRHGEDPSLIDMSIVRPVTEAHGKALSATLRQLADRQDLGVLMNYVPDGGSAAHRQAGAHWIGRRGLQVDPSQVIITSGAQHGLATVVAALTEPNDLLLTESLCYQGITAIASQLHRRRLRGVEMDRQGLIPEALEAACKEERPRAIIAVSTLQNPTTALMGEARRRRIAEIAREYDCWLIDDDVYGFLVENSPAPLASFAPERSLYITSLSKSLMPGLRVGYVAAPEGLVAPIAASVRTSVWMPPPLMGEIAALWIGDGTAEQLTRWQRREAQERQALAARILKGWEVETHPAGFHLWLVLPEPWRANVFAQQLRGRGVVVMSADFFAVGRVRAPHAVRLSLTAPGSREQLIRGLETIAELLACSPKPRVTVI